MKSIDQRYQMQMTGEMLRPKDLQNYESGDFIDEVLNTGKVIYKAA